MDGRFESSGWKDTPRNRVRWAQLQRNDAFLREQIRLRGNYALCCHYCNKMVNVYHWSSNYNGDDLATIDHVLPLSQGGADDPSNMVVACRPCNLKKGAS